MYAITLPSGAKQIIKTLSAAGFEAYMVGGCVRDSLLGLKPHDWDICTNALPSDILACFPNRKVIGTGLKHGTVTIVMDDDKYEITTFRIDGDYSDGRRPDKVEFTTSIYQDLARRDFTINAMAYSDGKGLIDPFGGKTDLQSGKIVCVRSPQERFQEDALRVLRALRFASVYGFEIGRNTRMALHMVGPSLSRISAERINAELCKLLLGKNVFHILREYTDIIAVIIPELADCIGFKPNNPNCTGTVYDHITLSVSRYTGSDIAVKMALLLHDVAKPHCYMEYNGVGYFRYHAEISKDISEGILERLRFDNRSRDAILELILHHDTSLTPTYKSVRRWLNRIGEERLRQLLAVKRADIPVQLTRFQMEKLAECAKVETILNEIIAKNQCFSLKNMNINGRDLMALGIPAGKQMGVILNELLDQVVNGELENDSATLKIVARELWSNGKQNCC